MERFSQLCAVTFVFFTMTGLLCSALESDKNLLSNRFFNQENKFIRLDDERETLAGAEDDRKEAEEEEEEEDSRMQMKKRSRDGENARSSAEVIDESNKSAEAERSQEANARENIINLRINKEKKNDRERRWRRLSDRRLSDRSFSDRRLSDRRLSDRRLTDRRFSDRRLSDRRHSKRRLSLTRSRQNDDDAAFGAANFTEDIDSKIEEDRKKLESSIQTKERNEVNAIQGAKEAEELTEAKEGDFSALSNEAIIEKKYVHDQHWYIPGTKPTDEARD